MNETMAHTAIKDLINKWKKKQKRNYKADEDSGFLIEEILNDLKKLSCLTALPIKIGDEVENIPIGTVSGVVYNIEDNLYSFVDEHGLHYKMKHVRKCNYLTNEERMKIIIDHNIN